MHDGPTAPHDAPGGWAIAVVGSVAVLVLCWLLLMPPGSGPDEPGHLVRAGAAARGHLGDDATFGLPDSYQLPEPGCYAFDPLTPVSCARLPQHAGDTVTLPSRAGEYPVWSHLVVGLPSRLPGLDPIWWARIAGGALAAALAGWALVTVGRTRPLAAAALLLGITPMAWSTFGTVNPSSMAIAGAVALWAGLLAESRGAEWLTAAGFAALALPRRDGLIWASIVLAIVLTLSARPALEWWRSLPRGAQAMIAGSAIAAIAWGLSTGDRTSQMVVLAPLVVLGTELARWWWGRAPDGRLTGVATGALVGVVALGLLLSRRPGGWSTGLAIDVIAQTDDNLIEAVGIMGWLDTSVPMIAVFAWCALVGTLVGVVLGGELRAPLAAAVLLGSTALTAWVFELYQGNTTGLYWQGRYSLPLLVGLPALLVSRTPEHTVLTRRAARVTGVGALAIANVGAWAAARRFGVGTRGSYLPWRWDTPLQPLPPILLLAGHAAASVVLLLAIAWRRSGIGAPVAR